MPAFQFVALNPQGQKQKGVLEAESDRHARQLLREKSLIPLETRATLGKKINLEKLAFFSRAQKKISTKDLALLTRQLATLLASSLPLEEALLAISEQSDKPFNKSLMLSVRGKVLEGYSLANAFAEFPDVFSSLYCATVTAGERTGHLDTVLERLAEYTEQQLVIKQKIQQALIYPSIMILVSVGIVGFLLEYVVPKMVAVYSNTNQVLPGVTVFLIGFSTGLKQYGLWMLVLLGIGVGFFRHFYKKNFQFKQRVHAKLLRLPLFGNAIKITNTARFSRTFSILSTAGVSIIDAMTIAAQLVTNIPIRKSLEDAARKIREGANIHLALRQTGYFPAMSLHLIASGEASGQLEAMLERAANNQENDIKQMIDTLLTLFEPAIILVMGAVVLFIVLAILLPIFQMDQMMG